MNKRDIKSGRFKKMVHTELVGNKYEKLTVIKDSGKRDHRKVVWECKCDCGNTTYVTTDSLKSGNTKSCGCGQQERYKMHTHNNPTFVEGTELGLLNTSIMFKHNTSGYRGVSRQKNGKYRAYICFKRKTYWLGVRDNIEEAVALRKEAEKNLFGNFLNWYKDNIKNNEK